MIGCHLMLTYDSKRFGLATHHVNPFRHTKPQICTHMMFAIDKRVGNMLDFANSMAMIEPNTIPIPASHGHHVTQPAFHTEYERPSSHI